jgi:hypothetical protein
MSMPTSAGSACVFVWRAHVLLAILVAAADAEPIVWTGPTTSFSKLGTASPGVPTSQDRLTDNVWITRGGAGSGGIFNIAPGKETFFDKINDDSPIDTEWATSAMIDNSGKTIAATNHLELTFTTWAESFGGPGGALIGNILSRNAVVHLITDDIYLDLRFTQFNSTGLFAYERSTPAPLMLRGDFNHDDTIDAADYVTWRIGFGSQFDEDDYNDWRNHFGQTVPPGAGASAAASIPEPSMALLLIQAITAGGIIGLRILVRYESSTMHLFRF